MKVAEKNRARNKKANTLTDALNEYGWFVFCKDFHLTGEVRDKTDFSACERKHCSSNSSSICSNRGRWMQSEQTNGLCG